MDPDDLQFYQAVEADDQDRCQRRRLFEERLKLERARQQQLDNAEFDAAIKRANESAL